MMSPNGRQSSSVVHSDRRVRHGDGYLRAPAEEIFDTDDSYFDNNGNKRTVRTYKTEYKVGAAGYMYTCQPVRLKIL